MILSERKIGKELAYYCALSFRTQLSARDAKKLSVLERGYVGECVYDKVFDEAGHGSIFIFRDIYLQIEESVAQYDTLIVSDDGIVVNEIKNYSGLYRYEEGKWFIQDYQVSEDALSQLKRAMGKLVKLKYQSGLTFNVDGKIIFPHIEFRLRSNDEELLNHTVMRSELRNYLMQFKNSYAGRYAEDIADIIRKHTVPNPYFDKSADFDAVKKGFYCGDCRSFDMTDNHFYMRCGECGGREKKETHVLRAISDFKSLFINEKMTRGRFMEFIDYQVSPGTVFRIFNKYCNQIVHGNRTHYVFRYHDFDEAYEKYENSCRYRDKVKIR